MKKGILIGILIVAIAGLCFAFAGTAEKETAHDAYLRVHIRANSNGEADQTVKYLVRDRVVEFLTPTVAGAEDKETAVSLIRGKLGEIAKVADEVLRRNGFFYGARASLREEEFPTRVYDGVTLEAGVYDALIVELGSGSGDNWWCVVYPPLCFTGGNSNVVYKSKILEIIDNFFRKGKNA